MQDLTRQTGWRWRKMVAAMAMGTALLLPACRSGEKRTPTAPEPSQPEDQQAGNNMPPVEVRETVYDDGSLSQQVTGYLDVDGEFVPHGALVNYWPNGQKKSQVHYVHGVRHGPRKAWYENGQVWSEGEFVDGGEHGTWIVWYPDGRKAQEINFQYGAFHGPYREWYPNGQLRKEFTYVNGKRQGTMRTWDEDGSLRDETEYVDDVPQP